MANRANRKNNMTAKKDRGDSRVIDKKESFQKEWDLDWFHPSDKQKDIRTSFYDNHLTVVQGSTGTGKSATAIWIALKEYREGNFDKIILIKNPTESGDDKLGFLKGGIKDKLEAHMLSMQELFTGFISRNKLANDIKNENITLTIPNFIQGMTFDNSLIIIEEAQNMSPATLKLCMERAGENTKVIVSGDRAQSYAISHRQDGLTDLISRITVTDYEVRIRDPAIEEGYVGFVDMPSENNMRSDLSKFVADLYES